MILDIINDDILDTAHPVIVFAINYEGYNDAGFAGMLSREFWPELANAGRTEPGHILTREVEHRGGSRHLCGIACHSLHEGKWDVEEIRLGLDRLATEHVRCDMSIEDARDEREELPAAVWMGHGIVGALSGGKSLPGLTMAGMARSLCPLSVYYR